MPRTTLDLDPEVLRELRRRSVQERLSVGRVASDLLAAALAEPKTDGTPQPFGWKVADLGAPLVDLEDGDALHVALTGTEGDRSA